MNDKADENSDKSKSVLGYKYPEKLGKDDRKKLLSQSNRDTLDEYVEYKNVCEKSVSKPVGSEEEKKDAKAIDDRDLACKNIYGDDYIPSEPEDVKPGLKIKIEGKINGLPITLKGYIIEIDKSMTDEDNIWWKVMWTERKMNEKTEYRSDYKIKKNHSDKEKITKYNDQRRIFGWPGEKINEFESGLNEEILNNNGKVIVNKSGLVNQSDISIEETCNSGTSRCNISKINDEGKKTIIKSCKEIVSNLLYTYKKPNDCIYTRWKPWEINSNTKTICNKTCMGKYNYPKKTRHRSILYQAELGGIKCKEDGSDLKDTQNCILSDMNGKLCYNNRKYTQNFQGYISFDSPIENFTDANGVNVNRIEIGDGRRKFCLSAIKVFNGKGEIIKQVKYNTSNNSCNKSKFTVDLGSEKEIYKLEIINHPNMKYQNAARNQVIKYISRGNVELTKYRGKLTHRLKQIHFPNLSSHVRIEKFTNNINTYESLGNNNVSYCVNDYLKK